MIIYDQEKHRISAAIAKPAMDPSELASRAECELNLASNRSKDTENVHPCCA